MTNKKKLITWFMNNGKWIIAGICLLLFVLIAEDLLQDSLGEIDTTIYNVVSSVRSHSLTIIVTILTNLSSFWFLGIACLILLFVLRKRHDGYYIIINLVNIVVLNQILKWVFARPRPIEWMMIIEQGYSFPSGHALASTAFYGFLIYLLWHSKTYKKYRYIGTIVLSILISLICVSRIYLGVHYASDVLAGLLLATAYLLIFTHFISKIRRQEHG